MTTKQLLRNMLAATVALFIAMFALPQQAMAQTKEAYVVKSTDGSTLTFYYDTHRASRTGTTYGIDQKRADNENVPAWAGGFKAPEETLTKAAFDASFKDYSPTNTSYWFNRCTKIETIEGMANLNTAQVSNMKGMFYGCKALSSLDLSNFNTANVTNMDYMFEGCRKLTSLDVSNFNTENVTDMNYMFDGCQALTTIHCDKDWNSGKAKTSTNMFTDCTKLKGAVTYDESKTGIEMANPTTGYFTKKDPTPTAYVVKSTDGSTLTFYYDAQRASRRGTIYGIDQKRTDNKNVPAWAGTSEAPEETLTKAAFDASFKDYSPANTSYWFNYCTKIETIEGMANLNTAQVSNMECMFYGCYALTSLDVSHFNTAKVTSIGGMFFSCQALTSLDVSHFNTEKVIDMSYMFNSCKSLTSLDVSNFNTANVIKMVAMFANCQALTSLDVSNFNTEKVTNMRYMFSGCQKLTSLDVSNFNTAKVTNMIHMFYFCPALTTIHCDKDWNSGEPKASGKMFSGCTKLKGAVSYDESKTGIEMANPTTGYFTKKDPTATYDLTICGTQVTSANCNDLSVIPGVSGTVKYDPSTKTLTLDNATITTTVNGYGIQSEVDGMKIQVKGTSSVTASLTAINAREPMTITGSGTLNLKSTNDCCIYVYKNAVTIDACTVNAKGTWGIAGYDGTSGENLTIHNATVTAEGSKSSICDLASLTLSGCAITQPTGAAFSASLHGVALNGKLVTSKVVISTEATGIDTPTADVPQKPRGVYNLQGVRLGDSLDGMPKGIYIVNGKKVVKQ